ncbi:MAG: aminopeptidase P family protein [Chlorobiales bacterium]|nr:aminopeptidase P family protein [Chlorobiales bacterium]
MIETVEKRSLTISSKLQRIREKLAMSGLDAMLVTYLPDVRWLTSFSGSNGTVLLTPADSWFFTDFRYQEQVKDEVTNSLPVVTAEGYVKELKSQKYACGKRIGFQSERLSFDAVERLRAELPDFEFVPIGGFFDDLVMVKEESELERMRKAVEISDRVFEKILPLLSPKVTELDVAAEISYWNKKFGADKDSFDPIVASGPRGALPHARPSNQHLLPNELVVIDMGCMYQGYASDQTRTVGVGRVSDEARKVYNLVLEAHLLGIESAKAGMTGTELDGIVRDFLTKKGYGQEFGHSLGHGVGLEVHEKPTVGKKGETKIPAGSVITIEPGVYLPGKFGVRIEDMVLVTASGAVPFQKSPKHLIEV